jgi:MbtH protein
MSRDDREAGTVYSVVVNHEEQYSIGPAHKDIPLGWKSAGKQGCKDECLAAPHPPHLDAQRLILSDPPGAGHRRSGPRARS